MLSIFPVSPVLKTGCQEGIQVNIKNIQDWPLVSELSNLGLQSVLTSGGNDYCIACIRAMPQIRKIPRFFNGSQ
jgi:hypothetical protein